MLLKYFYDKELAHASYMVGCQKTGEAILIDPDRHIDHYLEAASGEGMKIVATAETHIHADYVSGSRELAEKVGAKIYVSDEGPANWKYTFVEQYDHHLLKDADQFTVGNIKFEVLHTPGHTPESISFLLTDMGGGADRPMGLFTGDFVFVGSSGRPDLLEEVAGQEGSAEPGARDLYRSIEKFRELPDYLQIWPSHGAGSACGKGLGAIPSSTVGYEKLFNESLQFDSEDEFVQYILRDQPEAPPYFAVMKHVNKHGPKVMGDEGLPVHQAASQLNAVIGKHMVVDTTDWQTFAQNHVPGSINIPSKYIANQAGWFIDYQQPLYLIVNSATLAQTTRVLRAIGVDNIAGYFESSEVLAAGLATESYPYSPPKDLVDRIQSQEVQLIDVRQQAEWNDGRIAQADHRFLGNLLEDAAQLNTDKPIVFQCRSGGRSAVACSIAQANGIKNVINLDGGVSQWALEGYRLETDRLEKIGCAISSKTCN